MTEISLRKVMDVKGVNEVDLIKNIQECVRLNSSDGWQLDNDYCCDLICDTGGHYASWSAQLSFLRKVSA